MTFFLLVNWPGSIAVTNITVLDLKNGEQDKIILAILR